MVMQYTDWISLCLGTWAFHHLLTHHTWVRGSDHKDIPPSHAKELP